VDLARLVANAVMPSIGRIGRTLAAMATTLVVSSFVVFASLHLAPGGPLQFLAQGRSPSPEAIAMTKAQYGLDRPFLAQYLHWANGVLHGDLGTSFQFRTPVTSLLEARLAPTLTLIAMAALLISLVGVAAGVLSALNAGRVADKAVLVLVTALAAVPPFVAAILLISVFSVGLRWFPTFGAGDGMVDRLHHLALPSVALALTFVALLGRVTRSAMLDELGREHVEVALSRGIPTRRVVWRHVLRNAWGPITTVSGVVVAGLLVSSAVVESAFGLDGLGSLLVQSVDTRDFPVVQAIVLAVVVTFVVCNVLVDLLHTALDPRTLAGTAAR
jgi:peptide/nickel transport system permease protein